MTSEPAPPGPIEHTTYARVGIFGNPSDQYGGRTIAFSLANFHAKVTLMPSDTIRIDPHPVYDSTEYGSMQELVQRTSTQGLYGGVRLLLATCKRFSEYCAQHDVPLNPPAPPYSGFVLSYDSTIPRQTGLSGSSAIINSALHCLLQHYRVPPAALPPSARPSLVLGVEAGELGIAAGLQDRVVQVYGGVVHMDFDPQHMAAHGVGRYGRLPPAALPPLHIMFSDNPSESGKVHSGVKAKWLAGDPEVRRLMTEVITHGDIGLRLLQERMQRQGQMQAQGQGQGQGQGQQQSQKGAQGRAAGQQGQPDGADDAAADDDCGPGSWPQRFAAALNGNFDLRRALFGDEVLGARNLRMVELARSVGAGANFTGSGGAVVVYCPRGEAQAEQLRAAAQAEGYTLLRAQLGPDREALGPAPPAP